MLFSDNSLRYTCNISKCFSASVVGDKRNVAQAADAEMSTPAEIMRDGESETG